MKKGILTVCFLFSFFLVKILAQTRYLDTTYFNSVLVDTFNQYGNNFDYMGVSTDLYLDLYEPLGDTVTNRPLIIWMHGGGYTDGTRDEGYIRGWCRQFAKRGYVAASIDYRLGLGGANAKMKAIYRAVQDAKAAIRYFRQNAVTYGIDVNKIVLAGSSVGGFTAIHAAYWDTDELPASIDTTTLGNLEGASGNLGFSSDVNAVVNFWGAIKDTTWMDIGEPMIVSCAGTWDSTVYPEIYTWPLSGIEFGSIVVDRVAKSQNIVDTLRMFQGAKHTLQGGPQADQEARFDTATAFAAEFIYCNLITSCALSSIQESFNNNDVLIYPNPATEQIVIETGVQTFQEINIHNAMGTLVKGIPNTEKKSTMNVDLTDISPGIYFIQINSVRKKIIKQ